MVVSLGRGGGGVGGRSIKPWGHSEDGNFSACRVSGMLGLRIVNLREASAQIHNASSFHSFILSSWDINIYSCPRNPQES